MRARRFRPNFDRLDIRLVLSDVTPGVPGSGMGDLPPGSMPGDEIDPVQVVDYYGSGTPPGSQADPMDPAVAVPDYSYSNTAS